LVKSLLAIGRAGEAREVAAENAEVTERAGGGRGIGVARRVSGTTEEGDAAIDLLRESVEILTPTRARLQLAESLVELGAALRRANHRKEAREPLSEGLEIAHACGARSLEARARTELAAAGARPRNVVRSGVDSLTPSEMRVATLASEGLTNRQIAQSLTVTPKTVETHLRHVFQKLDLTKRTELSSALGRARPGANQSACERRG
jgi:DNA-binding CsgD family transcriptional regulator